MSPEYSPAIKDALNNAANAIKHSDLETGKVSLKWVLEREPNNALAWLWMSHCAETSEAKLECFDRVLAIDPSNRHALEGIQRFGGGARRGRRLINAERTPVGWDFWLMWVFATPVGGALGAAVGGAVGSALFFATGLIMGGFGALIFMGLAMGIAVGVASAGIAQGIVLRRQVSAGWWVLASIVGLAVSFAVVFTVVFNVGGGGAGAVGAVVGASVGIAQWLVLRRRVSRAGWWVLASTVGVAVGGALGVAMGGALGEAAGGALGNVEGGAVGIAVAFAVGGFWYGAFTGSVLVWLLRQPITDEPSLLQDAA